MDRLLLLLVLVSFGECDLRRLQHHGYRYTYRPQLWHYKKYDRQFGRLADHVIAADRYLQGFCKRNANCNVREIFEEQGYKLIYVLPQCSVDYISVKIKHKVMYMSAQQLRRRNPLTFVDMRILPDLLKYTDATWSYDEGKLEILIPYKVNFRSELEKTCGDVTTRVINVRQYGFRLGNRFGDDDDVEAETTEETNVYETTTDYYEMVESAFDDNKTNNTVTPNTNENAERLVFSP